MTSHPWVSQPPVRAGKHLWRKGEGQREYNVQVSFEFSIHGEVGHVWLCYELTDFTDMTAGGDWKFVQDKPTGNVPVAYVERLVRDSTWSAVAPTEPGRYLWREAEGSQPHLITIHEGVALRTNERERFVTSCGHATAEEFEALARTGQWVLVEDDVYS